MASAEEFEAHRPRLFGLAYRMLGSAADAEDAVQDAFLRWNGADRGTIASPSAWPTKVATNLCLNQLTSARARRESYIGPWLPDAMTVGMPVVLLILAQDPRLDAVRQTHSFRMIERRR